LLCERSFASGGAQIPHPWSQLANLLRNVFFFFQNTALTFPLFPLVWSAGCTGVQHAQCLLFLLGFILSRVCFDTADHLLFLQFMSLRAQSVFSKGLKWFKKKNLPDLQGDLYLLIVAFFANPIQKVLSASNCAVKRSSCYPWKGHLTTKHQYLSEITTSMSSSYLFLFLTSKWLKSGECEQPLSCMPGKE